MSLARTSDLSYLNLEGPTPKTSNVPVGTKSPFTQLRRMALKDIKNEPNVNSGLKRPLGSLKRRLSDSECQSLQQCKSKLGKVDLEMDKDCGFTGPKSEQNMTICTHLTNTPLGLQDEERNESAEISSRRVQKNKDGIVAPVVTKLFQPVLHGSLFSPLDCSSTPKILGNSSVPLSYFTDLSVPFQEQESAKASSNENKFFSTPMPSKAAKKKLTPVMEVDFESNMLEEWQPQDKVSRTDVLHKNCADVLSNDSPIHTPLYRSSFATECQDIIQHIKSLKPAVKKSPSKWKVEEVDVSSIDAEPPPYDSTPMKSMLACEVAKVIASLESSPVKEGPSLCGESLLDLEKTDLPIDLSLLSSRPNSVYLKEQKTENFEKTGIDPVNEVNKNVSDQATPETLAVESLPILAASKCHDEEITAHISNNGLHTEHKLPDNVTEAAVMIQDVAVAHNVSQVATASCHALASTTGSLVPVHEEAIVACNGPLNKTKEYKQCANTPHDTVSDEEVLTNATYELNKASNARPSSTSIHEEKTTPNSTYVIEMSKLSSGNTTYDCAGPANTTRDIGEAVTESNTSQVTEGKPQLLLNTTNDIPSMHKSIMDKTASPFQLRVLYCQSKTQESASVQAAILMANTTHEISSSCPQDVSVVPKASVEVLSLNEANPTGCNDAVPEKLGTGKESFEPPLEERVPTNGDHLVKDVVQPSLDMDLDVPPPHNVVIRDINLSGTTGINVEITTNSDHDLAVEKDLVMSNHGKVSEFDPKLTLVVYDEKLTHVEPTQASVVGLTHASVDPSTLISPTAQAKPNVTEGHQLEEYEKNCNGCTGMVSSQKEGDIGKEARSQQLVSESCNLIQEEESTHDVSAFSVGSLSFITSTPVPGLNNFPFQKTCRESVQLDSNLSLGSVLDDSANKVPGEQKKTNCKDQGREEILLHTLGGRNDLRSMVPSSDAVPKPMPSTSGIPSVRRSLVPYPNTVQNAAKDQTASKIPARGIPGKSMIRPPVPRQNLPRPSLVNPKPVTDGPGGSSMTNKPAGNRLGPPKAVAVVKAKSDITHSQLPAVTPSIKLPSRLGAPGTTGRRNAAANPHVAPSAETTSVVRPPISTGIRTGLPRPGTSSTRPPLQQSQKVSPKLKSQVQ
ncbi:hypothetical protein GDO78_013149, partial [Eleutherodactylus coqui]